VVFTGLVHAPEFGLLLGREFRLPAAQSSLALATASRARIRSRSTSNSANVARMSKNISPVGSLGS
jgi:hypothetical protein